MPNRWMGTRAEWNLISILREGGQYIRGSEVRVAKSLATRNRVRLEDNGSLDGKGNPDGERWWCEAVKP